MRRRPGEALESGWSPVAKWITPRPAFPQQLRAGDDATLEPPGRTPMGRRDRPGPAPFTPAAPPPAILANQRPEAAAAARPTVPLLAAHAGKGRPAPPHCSRLWGAGGARQFSRPQPPPDHSDGGQLRATAGRRGLRDGSGSLAPAGASRAGEGLGPRGQRAGKNVERSRVPCPGG